MQYLLLTNIHQVDLPTYVWTCMYCAATSIVN